MLKISESVNFLKMGKLSNLTQLNNCYRLQNKVRGLLPAVGELLE